MLDLVDWAGARLPERALFAFNTNVDAVKKVRASGIDFRSLPGEISALEECMVKGIGREVVVSEGTIRFLSSRIGFDDLQVGGQAGISACAASRLGVQAFLHVAEKGETQLSVLDKNVFIASENGFLSVRDARPVGGSETHFILEFSAGDLVFGKKIPFSNRFIASRDSSGSELKVDGHFEQAVSEKIAGIDRMLVGGFHLLSPKFLDRVDFISNIVSEWKKKNASLRVHLELGEFQDLGVLKKVLNVLLPVCDSVGLNELELRQCVKALDERPRSDFLDARILLSGVRNVVVHTRDYSFCLSKDKRAQELRNALLFASLNACFRAFTGNFAGLSDLKNFDKGKPSDFAVEKEQELDSLKLDCVKAFAPSFLLENPKRTVGLGDVFAASFCLTV